MPAVEEHTNRRVSAATVPIEEAVGMVLPHDITEIVKDLRKGRAFKKGHIIRPEDIAVLRRLGKEHVYVLNLGPEDVHENEAAQIFACTLAGEGISYDSEPSEGKIAFTASIDGLLKINREALLRFNMLGEVMCATLQTNTPVRRGEQVGATRLIPLVTRRTLVEEAVAAAQQSGEAVLRVLPMRQAAAGLVITGNEVYKGCIADRFEEVLRAKLLALGASVMQVRFAPDDPKQIAAEIHACLDAGADLIITSGGMSVDPDDVTRLGIALAGAEQLVYGTPVLPGAMLAVGRIGKVPVIGLPACGMYHGITVFDLILPRILVGEQIGRTELAELGHGGFCRNCQVCQYPVCSFGKS
ncbi:MAG: molybdopterin-binding protein [Desulfobulbaceae bacterium]|nr:molybdopterin-binding protein [Desulfobulbaceae bacterium]